MKLTSECILMNSAKRTSKRGTEYIQITLLDNITSDVLSTYSDNFKLLDLEKLKEYKFTFIYNKKFKDLKVINIEIL
ncbi:MAG: hypothetical protein AB7E42_03170 [Anaerotignaceae bacterium]